MANKFTKSVLERQYLEKKRTAGAEDTPHEELTTPVPEPAARTEEPAAPAAGIDEAFERVDSAPAQPQVSEWQTTNPLAEAKAPQSAEPAEKQGGMGNAMSDLVESYLIRTPERVAKNKTFYLDEAVIGGIRAAAKKQKVTESKLVNDILRGVLGIH